MWLHQITEVNSTDITKAVIMIIQLKHSPQLSSKLELNLQTTVWGWVVGPDYGV